MPGVTRRVLAKDPPRVTRSYDQDPVGQFAVQCPGEALADRIRPRCAWGVLMISLASASNTRVEHRGVFRVPVPDQESQLLQPRTEVHRQVPGLLGDPAAGRVGRHAGDMQVPGRMPAKISTYKRLSSTCRCAGSHRRLSGAPVPDRQELTPGRAATPRRGAGPCQLQDFPPGRVRDRVTEPVKLALDPAVTSARVCPGHRNDELLDRRSGRWAAAGRRWG